MSSLGMVLWIAALFAASAFGLYLARCADRSKNREHLRWAKQVCSSSEFQLSNSFNNLGDLPSAWVSIIDRPIYTRIEPVMWCEIDGCTATVFRYNYTGMKISSTATIVVIETDRIGNSNSDPENCISINRNTLDEVDALPGDQHDSVMEQAASLLDVVSPFFKSNIVGEVRVAGKIAVAMASPARSKEDYARLVSIVSEIKGDTIRPG